MVPSLSYPEQINKKPNQNGRQKNKLNVQEKYLYQDNIVLLDNIVVCRDVSHSDNKDH
jgi:hypothetical protein